MWVMIGLLQPILYLVLFGPILQTVAKTSGFTGDAWQRESWRVELRFIF